MVEIDWCGVLMSGPPDVLLWPVMLLNGPASIIVGPFGHVIGFNSVLDWNPFGIYVVRSRCVSAALCFSPLVEYEAERAATRADLIVVAEIAATRARRLVRVERLVTRGCPSRGGLRQSTWRPVSSLDCLSFCFYFACDFLGFGSDMGLQNACKISLYCAYARDVLCLICYYSHVRYTGYSKWLFCWCC